MTEEELAYQKIVEGLGDVLDFSEIEDGEWALFSVYIFRNGVDIHLDTPRIHVLGESVENVHSH